MFNKLDYSYNDGFSVIHKINPVVKFFGLFIYILLCLLKYNNYLFIGSLTFVFLTILLSNVSILRYIKVIWKFKYIIIIMYFVMYHYNIEISDINIIVFKVMFLILYLVMIIYTTTKEDISKGMAKIFNIFNLIGIKIKKITTFFINSITRLLLFLETFSEILINAEIKGNVYSHTNLFGRFKVYRDCLKIICLKCKDKMLARKKDMKYKLYNGNIINRYKYKIRLRYYDYLFILINIAFIVIYVLKVR